LDVIKSLNALKFLEHDEYIALSESVYLPSRLKITVSSEDLYRFQIENAAYDPFIKTLLRSYGGLYEQYVSIREYDLAKRSAFTYAQVIDNLKKLEGFGLVSYLPQTDKPQLQFIKPRTDSKNLLIDTRYLKERSQIRVEQVNAVISYAETNKCR